MKHKLTGPIQQPAGTRPSAAQIRVARAASLSTQQSDLKREAAERRAQRTEQNAKATSTSQRSVGETGHNAP